MFGFAATHAQFNRKSDIFGLPIGSFQVAVSRLLVKGNKDGWYEGCIVIVISSSDNNKLSSPLRQFFLFRNMREVKIQT